MDTLTHVTVVIFLMVNLNQVPAGTLFDTAKTGARFCLVCSAVKFGVLVPVLKMAVAGGNGLNGGVLVLYTSTAHVPMFADTISQLFIVHAYGTLT